jgi:RHS repeat-associated protein
MRLLPGIAASLLLLLTATAARGQTTPDAEEGMKPYGSFHGGEIDSVSLTSGKLTLNLPLASYPQRGGKINLTFSENYVNPALSLAKICPPHSNCINVAERIGLGLYKIDDFWPSVGSVEVVGANGVDVGSTWAVVMPDRAQHQMGQTGSTFRSIDATGYRYDPTASVLTDSKGIRSTYNNQTGQLTTIEDSNGNEVTWNGSGWTDTLGRTITDPTYATTTTNYSGCTGNQTTVSANVWTIPGPSGANVTLKFCYAQFSFNFSLNGYGSSGTSTQLQSIVLPNGTAWTFAYDTTYAAISQVTLPTGGTISYTWTAVNQPCQWSGSQIPGGQGGTKTTTVFTLDVTSRTINANDGTGSHTWTYGLPPTSPTTTPLTVTDPLGNDTVHYITGLGGSGSYYETEAQYYQGSQSSGTLLKTVNTDYSWTSDPNSLQSAPGCNTVINTVPIRTTTTWPNGKVTKVETDYDSGFTYTSASPSSPNYNAIYGLPVAKRGYDYGNGSPGPLLRTTNTNYLALSNSTYATNNLLDAVSSVQILDSGGTQRAYTTYGYDEYALANVGAISTQHDSSPPDGTSRGNQTSVHRWLNGSTVLTTNCPISVSNGYLVSFATYNDTGTVNTSVDSCGTSYTDANHTTAYAYSTNYVGAYPTLITNPKNQQTSHTYDLNTGLLMSTTDPNSQTTSFTYDNLWRLASASYPDGGLDTITRQETTPPFTATLTKAITSGTNYVTTNIFDGLGRVSQSQLTSDPQGTVYTVTTYDADGRKATVTNPYRATGDPTYGVTSYVYDGIGRTCVVVPPDGTAVSGSTCPATQPSNDVFTTYLGNTTTVTDQQGKSRTSQTDGLGRLTNIWEDPNGLDYQTVYTYDALDDLASVAQGSSRNRSFVFDSLKHMTSSTNPEAGTVTYAYDADSNVITKADARSITITYSYDTLNRMTGRTYSNGDPSVSYTYDQTTCLAGETACYNVGRRTSVTDAGGSEEFSYDKMGREWAEQRTTNSITKSTTYTYNLDGSLATLTYPSGRTIAYAYSAAARPLSAIDSANSINYATLGAYAPQGALAGLTLGQAGSFAGISFVASYTNRLQPNEFKASSTAGTAMDLTYNFLDASSHNNGNVMGITNNRDTTRSQSFTYDSLNRIATAKTSSTSGSNCWGETYTIDQWANLTAIGALSGYTGCTQEGLSVTATTNNQLSATGFSYDAAGNMLGDAVNTYGWNAESEIKSTAGVNYTYDGDGNRIQKSNGKIYWYGAGTEILDESDSSGNITDEYVFFGGKRVAHRVVSSGGIYYYAEDFLGTSRALTTSTGTLCYDADFYPFGGERVVTNTCAQNYKFEGKERDTETGNDDFGARYYTSRLGRWLSADWSSVPAPVPYANLANPQTLNLYAMARDNPETFADLDGHYHSGTVGDVEGDDTWAGDFSPLEDKDANMNAAGATPKQIDAVHKVDKWKQEVERTIEFQKDARAAYRKFGRTAKTVEELEAEVTKSLEEKWGKTEVAGTTNSSGEVEIKPDPDPYTREATKRHEDVHRKTTESGIAKYGRNTAAFYQWWYNPQRWATDEVNAYSAGIAYLEQALRQMNTSK